MSQPDGLTILDRYFEYEKDNAEITYKVIAYVNDEKVAKVEVSDTESLEEELYKLDDRVDYYIAEMVREKWEAGEYGEREQDDD